MNDSEFQKLRAAIASGKPISDRDTQRTVTAALSKPAPPATEHDIQNQIRAELSHWGKFFRVNVGSGWTGNTIQKTTDGGVYIPNARPMASGLPVGYSDLSGVVTVTITPEMVGQQIGVAAFIEVKTNKGRATPEQLNFIEVMRSAGARAGVARTPEEAVKIARGEP